MNDNDKKKENNLILKSEIKTKEENNKKKELESYINNIKSVLEKNMPQNGAFLIKRINILLIKITSFFDLLLKENKLILKYERMLQKEENKIRRLYNDIFYLKSTIDYQENTILKYASKEKEFEKLKEKIGAFYSNGKLIYNGRKDNEIMILRTENSNLKSFIEKKEKDIETKEKEIIKLKEQLLIFNKNKKNNKKKKLNTKNNSLPNINDLKYSYSNININFNEITSPDALQNYNSIFKKEDKSSNEGNGKTIYIPPQLRNDLSLKELFSKKNIYDLYKHKKIKRKKISESNSKLNLLSNADKFISVNKSNKNLLSNKRKERIFTNTVNNDINLNNIPDSNSPNINKSKNVINLKSYFDKDLGKRRTDRIVKKIINKIHYTDSGKKIPFYSHFASPISKYSKNNLKKNKLIFK